jgi:N-carbamoylputrescine amidase
MSAPKEKKVKIGLVQMTCSADPAENLAKAIEKVREAADLGAQIICLQELFTSQYFCQIEDHKYFQLAEEIPGPSTAALSQVAAERGVVIVGVAFREAQRGRVSQYRCGHRR